MSHRVTYFFFHSLFRDLPLRLSRMPWGQRLHQRREPGPCVIGRGEGLSAQGPHGPLPPSSPVTVRVGPETPCGTEAEPGRAAQTSPATGLRAASPVTVDHCPIGGGAPYPRLWGYIHNGRRGFGWLRRISRGAVEHRDLRGPWPPNPRGSPRIRKTST